MRDGRMEGRKRETIHLSLYTVTTTMTLALRWAAMKCFINSEGQKSQLRQCPQIITFLKRRESQSRLKPSPLLLTRLTPYR